MPGVGAASWSLGRNSGVAPWTPQSELGGELPSMYVKTDSRSGLTLVDSINSANNPTILPAVYLRTGLGYFNGLKTRVEEHLLDGGDYTLFTEVSQLVDIPTTSTFQIMGFGLNSGAVGRGVYIGVKSNNIALYIGDGVLASDLLVSSGVIDTVNTNFKPYGRLYMLMTINFTTKILSISFYNTDKTRRGGIVNKSISTITFNTNDNALAYSFNSLYFGLSNFKKFNAIKTLDNCLDDTYVADLQLHYPSIQGYVDMIAGLNLSGSNTQNQPFTAYSNHNNQWLLKYGYDIYRANINYPTLTDSVDQIIPHKSDGTSAIFSKANFTLVNSVQGSLINHNDADCKIRFIQDFFDRSNVTIWSDLARGTGYNSVNPKDFHISKLNQRTLYEWLNVGYKGRLYVKCENNSIEDGSENCLRKGSRGVLQEIILYDTDKVGLDNKKVLTYTNDIIASVLTGLIPSFDVNNYIKLGYLKTDRPMITFRIDDGIPTEFPAWKNIFDEYGIIGVVPCNVGRNANPLLNLWNLPFATLLSLQNDGWEIPSHGMDDDDLSGQAESVAESELPESLTALESRGFVANHYVGHKYATEAMWVRRIASQYFQSSHSWSTSEAPETCNPAILDIWNISALGLDIGGATFVIVDVGTDVANPAGIANVKGQIDIAKLENRWVILLFHSWTVNKEAGIREIIQYAQTESVDVVTFSQAFANRKYL